MPGFFCPSPTEFQTNPLIYSLSRVGATGGVDVPWVSSSALQSCCGPCLGTGAFLCFAFILPQTCPQTWHHKFPGFSHLCVVLLLRPNCSLEPADLLCLLQQPPSSSSIPLPHSTRPLGRFEGETGPPHLPRFMGGRMCPLIVHSRPWLVTGYLAK